MVYERERHALKRMVCAMLGCEWRFVWASRTSTYSYVQCSRCGEVGWQVAQGEK